MRCVAVIEADQPALDTVILWTDNDRLVAFAYLNGQVKMTRPLAAATLDDAVTETVAAFQVTSAQITRIANWDNIAARPEPAATASRWEITR